MCMLLLAYSCEKPEREIEPEIIYKTYIITVAESEVIMIYWAVLELQGDIERRFDNVTVERNGLVLTVKVPEADGDRLVEFAHACTYLISIVEQ